ncbi:ComEA family DNA-binding protein [Reichenbachiella ulvae]|uniref:Helix-hairpin-helix domain-containing protein n=1 Tax=Reichenbachiella ulvae TaxID=2980104 RepID=A0ABT3CX45_9BACT|nr:helix-hairpin-helix domain-containing protein [Reichenbachiella ulvae]MCV9388050.1 helix-hairpin-helix domain-containing protein [Reichenbachiella ulvae]
MKERILSLRISFRIHYFRWMTSRIANYLRRYFGFSSHEIRGFFVLIPLLILVLVLPRFYKMYLLSQPDDSSEIDEAILVEWKKEIEASLTQKENQFEITERFDPNIISAERWEQLGFKPYIAARIRKYLDKGGKFWEVEDVKAIYGIDESRVDEIAKWMIFPEKQRTYKRPVRDNNPSWKSSENSSTKSASPAKEKTIYELNLADTAQLQSIRGIGSYWSNKVVNYREALGGFVDRMQIYEIYYMKDSVADLIIDNTRFEVQNIRQLNVNAADQETLSKHPYMDYKLANAIVKYRNQHGDYQSLEELRKIYILTQEDFERLQPYLKISD